MRNAKKCEVVVTRRKNAPRWHVPRMSVYAKEKLQALWPKPLSIESSLYASHCHKGRTGFTP